MYIYVYVYIYIHVNMYMTCIHVSMYICEFERNRKSHSRAEATFPFPLGCSAVYLTKISTYKYNVVNPGMRGKLPFDDYYLVKLPLLLQSLNILTFVFFTHSYHQICLASLYKTLPPFVSPTTCATATTCETPKSRPQQVVLMVEYPLVIVFNSV